MFSNRTIQQVNNQIIQMLLIDMKIIITNIFFFSLISGMLIYFIYSYGNTPSIIKVESQQLITQSNKNAFYNVKTYSIQTSLKQLETSPQCSIDTQKLFCQHPFFSAHQ